MKSYLLILSTFLTIFPAFLLGTNPDNDLVVLRPIPIRPPSRLTVLTRFTLEETGLTQEESAAIELRDILTGRTNHSITSPRTNNSMTPTRTTTPINLGQPDKEKQNCLQKLAKKNNIQLSQKPLKPKPNSSNNKFCQSNQQSTHNSQRQYSLPEPQQRHQNYLQNNQTSLVSQDIQNIQYNPNNPNPYQQRQQWPQNPPNPYNNQFNHSNQINHRLIQNSQNYSQPNQTNYNPNNYQQPQQRYQNYPPNNQTSLRSQDRQNIQYNPNNQNPDQQRQQWSQNPSNPYNNNQFNHSN
ncbi:hypothetical protein HOB95_01980, partial [bacterium]|nr:hypothetical protein [bacterium]